MLIVGAGPSGLVLANILAVHGVDFRIVDKKSGPVGQSRAALIHVRTLELLDRLGLAERAIARGVPTSRIEVYERGRPVAGFPLAGKGTASLTKFGHALGLEQDRIERLLIEGLAEHGRGVDWETALITLSRDQGRSRVVLRHPGGEEVISARWVVGADGARSPVRHALGIDFSGTTYDQTGLLADVDLDLPAGERLRPGTIRLNLTRGGFVGMFRLSSGRCRLFGAVPPALTAPATAPARSTAPSTAGTAGNEVSHEAYAHVTLGDLQRWFDEYFFVGARVRRAAWTALFRIHSRIAERFRVGNVFLLGDAAHIHSPAGGQGMNLGVGDAFNLGWKLALVAGGRAYDHLLDSYQAERYPAAMAVLRGSDRGFALETTRNPAAAWARTHIAPHLVGPLLRLEAIQARIFRLFSQTWIGYRDSPAVTGNRRSRRTPPARAIALRTGPPPWPLTAARQPPPI